jgi:hypothetical protein
MNYPVLVQKTTNLLQSKLHKCEPGWETGFFIEKQIEKKYATEYRNGQSR